MATLAGTDGVLKVGATPATVLNLKSWSLQTSLEIIDKSVLGVGSFRQKQASFNDWSLSAMGFLDPADTTGQIAIRTAFVNRTELPIALYPSGTDPGDEKYTGNVLVKNFNPNGSFEGLVELALEFEGTGAITFGVEV